MDKEKDVNDLIQEAKENGIEISRDEAERALSEFGTELSDDDLTRVAGGATQTYSVGERVRYISTSGSYSYIGTIRSFRGFDSNGVELYHVTFENGRTFPITSANLEKL